MFSIYLIEWIKGTMKTPPFIVGRFDPSKILKKESVLLVVTAVVFIFMHWQDQTKFGEVDEFESDVHLMYHVQGTSMDFTSTSTTFHNKCALLMIIVP